MKNFIKKFQILKKKLAKSNLLKVCSKEEEV